MSIPLSSLPVLPGLPGSTDSNGDNLLARKAAPGGAAPGVFADLLSSASPGAKETGQAEASPGALPAAAGFTGWRPLGSFPGSGTAAQPTGVEVLTLPLADPVETVDSSSDLADGLPLPSDDAPAGQVFPAKAQAEVPRGIAIRPYSRMRAAASLPATDAQPSSGSGRATLSAGEKPLVTDELETDETLSDDAPAECTPAGKTPRASQGLGIGDNELLAAAWQVNLPPALLSTRPSAPVPANAPAEEATDLAGTFQADRGSARDAFAPAPAETGTSVATSTTAVYPGFVHRRGPAGSDRDEVSNPDQMTAPAKTGFAAPTDVGSEPVPATRFTPVANVVQPESPAAPSHQASLPTLADVPAGAGALPAQSASLVVATVAGSSRKPVSIPGGKPWAQDRAGRAGEKNAASSAERGSSIENSFSLKDKKILAADEQGDSDGVEGLGIAVAKADGIMSSPALHRPATPLERGDAPVGADKVSAAADTAVSAGVDAHRAVDAALSAAERLSTTRQSVDLQFAFQGADLAVRLEMRAGELHATFRTDSPELREALASQWQAAAASDAGSPLRIVEPVFSTSAQSDAGDLASGDQSSFSRREPGSGESARETFSPAFGRETSPGQPETESRSPRASRSSNQLLNAFA